MEARRRYAISGHERIELNAVEAVMDTLGGVRVPGHDVDLRKGYRAGVNHPIEGFSAEAEVRGRLFERDIPGDDWLRGSLRTHT